MLINIIFDNHIYMIVRQTQRIFQNFARIVKPKLSKYQNVFDLMRDRTQEFKFIENRNREILNINKMTAIEDILINKLGVSQKTSGEISKTAMHTYAYSPIWMKPYRISQKLDGQVQIQGNANEVEGLYRPGHQNLKFHYSITNDVPNLQQYKINKSTAYIFNLPESVTEKQLLMELGYRLVKSIKIKYCMLGLPAYAVVEFNSENHLTEKIINNQLKINLGSKICRIVTQSQSHKLPLNRRQIVIKGLSEGETPSSMLKQLSAFGRVINLSFPMGIYREQSLKQIKQLYKNEKAPIKLNYYKQDGTIQSQYYPPFESTVITTDLLKSKQQEYKRRLRYCENVNIHQGQQGKINIKSKGFCVVTYSCQQEAQNCYFQLRTFKKMDLLNGRDQFEFDQKHYEALLRFIDNGYIENAKKGNPTSDYQEKMAKLNSTVFQNLYLTMIYQQMRQEYYKGTLSQITANQNAPELQLHYRYKRYINELKNSIGKSNLNPKDFSEDDLYGKSFDQLAEEELYGIKLKNRGKKQRYEVNIDDYVRPQPEALLRIRKKKVTSQHDQSFDKLQSIENYIKNGPRSHQGGEEQGDQGHSHDEGGQEKSDDLTNQPKHGFSTFRELNTQYRPKTFQEQVKSHMRYNRFVRDTINQYMGIFPVQKFQSQFNCKKPTLTNPQSLKFSNGEEFLKEDEVRNVLQFSNNILAQQVYNQFVKQNQVFKSLNIDIQEHLLKNFQQNEANILQYYTDVGIIKEEYEYKGDNIEEALEKLNLEAQFGEQYKIVSDKAKGVNKIIKIAKLQHIYPLDLMEKYEQQVQQIRNEEDFDPKTAQIVQKYQQYFWNGQPIPDELAEAFDLEKGSIIDGNKIADQICQSYDITKKDFQKIMNVRNYSQQQIQRDIAQQIQISKVREKHAPRKASDYSRDPSDIKVKGRSNRSIVSKFRQI